MKMSRLEAELENKEAWLAGSADVVVIGSGHAGCEAALAAARLGCETLLFGMNLDVVANMPCNPNIGGTAKGQLVREIDALGGEMGRAADRGMIQFRMLNTSKGPAVLSPRAQIDRRAYQAIMKQTLERQPRLTLKQGEIVDIYCEEDACGIRVSGVRTRAGAIYRCRAAVVATGTYLEGRVIIGDCSYSSGPDGLFPARGLSDALRSLGLPLQRFKTGTPERINRLSVDFSKMERQDGDPRVIPFSFENEGAQILESDRQIPCWLTYTTPATRQAVTDNLHRSPLFSGDIEGIGPRYCPSIEDKFVKFPDKERHQVFLEPMGRETEEMYLQGMSSSMPEDVQLKMVRSLPGLENAKIQRSAYAIEYDCLDPTCLDLSLESKAVRGLFGAGQVNGTSGYEEAAAQGLVAGINAARGLAGLDPLVIDRSSGYIGVLIDDLVTKGTSEPYRMMTARAEYRLMLRQDNADARLTPLGRQVGLISDERWSRFQLKQQHIQDEVERCRQTRIQPSEAVNQLLAQHDSTPLRGGTTLADLVKRPELGYRCLAPIDPGRPELTWSEQYAAEVQIKYEGYIRLEQDRIDQFKKTERRHLPPDIDYLSINGLRLEARQKLQRLRPVSVGQASRISGVSPADISVLLVYLQMLRKNEAEGAGRG
jgi:tRNA uridine 5-carboxymethylaminomethyl modification enzyme